MRTGKEPSFISLLCSEHWVPLLSLSLSVPMTWHFSHHFPFVKHILKGSGSPIGEVVDYFWRIEFQLRGSPHVHSLWWVKDAPNLQTVEGLRATPDFIDRYITTRVPSGDSCDAELRRLVLRVQKHNHTHMS